MQLDKLTQKSQEALQDAQRIAREHSHQEMDGEHLLLALINQQESLVPELLARIGVPPAKLQPDLEKELARRHKIQGGGDPYAGRDLQKALDAAQAEANKSRTITSAPNICCLVCWILRACRSRKFLPRTASSATQC
jgi:ATP-dependent Clp protease ATP-binding subunit ClpB